MHAFLLKKKDLGTFDYATINFLGLTIHNKLIIIITAYLYVSHNIVRNFTSS